MQTIDPKQIGARFREKRLESGLTQTQFGERTGIQQSALSGIENGDRLPTTEQLLQVIEAYAGSADWWLFGDKLVDYVSDPAAEYTVSLPVRAQAGAGNPCCIDELEPIGKINVEKSYDGPNIQVLKIRGTSMEPTIMDGAHVGIDVTSRQVISGQMYAIYLPYEGIVVKRIDIGLEYIKIISDNPRFLDHDIPIKKINKDNFVQGRVVWTIQKYNLRSED